MAETTQTRERSSIRFPYGDLDDALELARVIHANFGFECSLDQLAGAMGYNVSGAFRNKIATAATFGLLETIRGGQVQLTELGSRALDPQTEDAAKVEAFLAVPLYAAVFERFKGRNLPHDQGFEHELGRLGVSPKVSAKARQSLQRSAEQAGFFRHGRERLVKPGPTMPAVASVEPDESPHTRPAPARSESTLPVRHPLLVGLWQELPDPKAGSFDAQRQREWLDAAQVVLRLLYGGSESQRELTEGDVLGASSIEHLRPS